jgi:hypothetical protein
MKQLYFPLGLTLIVLTSFSASKWIDFAVDEKMSVKLPSQPTVIARDTVEADGFEQHLKIYKADDESGFYRISRDDLHHESDNYLTPQGRKEWYTVGPVVEGIQQAKFLSREVFDVKGVDGVERTYELPASGPYGHTLKYVRTLLVGKVGYEFWFIPKDGFSNPSLDKKKQFFNSIKLKN